MTHMISVTYGYAPLEFEVITAGTYIIEAGTTTSGTPGTCTLVVTSHQLAQIRQPHNNASTFSRLRLVPSPRLATTAARRLHHLLQVILPVSHMASLAKAVPKAGYGTSAIKYVLPTMGR